MKEFHLVKGLDPVADAFSGTATSDIVDAQGGGVHFIIYKGVGATGVSTITVEACDDTTPSNTTAVVFHYRTCTTSDTWGNWTSAAATGFSTTAGSSQLYQIYVDAGVLGDQGYGYVRLKAVESTDNPVLGGILVLVEELRYREQPSSLID